MRAIRSTIAVLALLAAGSAFAESVEELLARSEAAYAAGRLDEAIAILAARLEHPEASDKLIPIHGTLGDLYLERGDPSRALEHFDRIAADHPDYARAHYKRGLALEHAARFLEAIDAYAIAGEKRYDEAEIRARIGFNYALLANHPATPSEERTRYAERARNSLARAVELEPRNQAALGNLADIHFGLGELERALDAYQRLDRMEPSRPLTLARIGNTYLRMGQCEPAVESLLRAAAILREAEPKTPADTNLFRDVEVFSRIRAAECLIALERPEPARSEIARVLELGSCEGCAASSPEMDRSKLRAEVLLLQLDQAAPASAGSER